jgi:hypothetical protein
MIIAVEVNKMEWDFFCTDKWELDKALEIVGDELKMGLITHSKFSFRAPLTDIKSVTDALFENGIDLYYENEKETMISFDNYTENTRGLPIASFPVVFGEKIY